MELSGLLVIIIVVNPIGLIFIQFTPISMDVEIPG